jgi:methylase of polypeptide subunit release factors
MSDSRADGAVAAEDRALLDLLEAAQAQDYRFVTITPESHRRVVARRTGEAKDLRDVFGWSLPFRESLLPAPILDALRRSGFLVRSGDGWKSEVRISSIGGSLFLHSAYPTDDRDSVFLGPDTYRFVSLLEAELPRLGPVRRLIDVGAGAGVGGILAGRLLGTARVVLGDVNPAALRLARINAAFAGVAVETVLGAGLDGVAGEIDLALANPPFVMDEAGRAYRDGGEMHGAGLSLAWTLAAARRIAPGGTIILYTGSPIVAGEDRLRSALESRLPGMGCSFRYREIDPDIFGELLSEPRYEGVERIAAVAAIVDREPSGG